MERERREEQRFMVKLTLGNINHPPLYGEVKDFSRKGMRVVFAQFDFPENARLEMTIQRSNYNELVPASAKVIWKKHIAGKWEVGFKFTDLPSAAKADFLEYAYKKWLKENSPAINPL